VAPTELFRVGNSIEVSLSWTSEIIEVFSISSFSELQVVPLQEQLSNEHNLLSPVAEGNETIIVGCSDVSEVEEATAEVFYELVHWNHEEKRDLLRPTGSKGLLQIKNLSW